MKPSRVEQAVLNNTQWYRALFEAHGLASRIDGRVWLSHQVAPPFHSNLVVLSPATSQREVEAHVRQIESVPRPAGWSLKDSYAALDLSPLGFDILFEAEWIWRDPIESAARDPVSRRLLWSRVATAAELSEWEDAWWGDARAAARQFPERLGASPDLAFLAGRLDGRIVAGCMANRSPGVVGLSNLFSPEAFADEAWDALAKGVSAAFANLPIVGYERGADLERARRVGFVPVGALRVWRRPG